MVEEADLAWDRPGAEIPLRPERAAGMDEQHLEHAVRPAVQQ